MVEQALKGIRIADFSWVGALPMALKFLGDFGAEVIKLESSHAIDFARVTEPYVGKPGINRSGVFALISNHKLSFALNFDHPKAPEIAKRLIAQCDLVTEGFRPGTMKKWGLDYESVKKVKPDIIMLSSSLMGQTGPESGVAAFGHHGGPLAGFGELIGWPDRAGVGPGNAYTDHVAPWFAVISVMAALDYRNRTGKGQYIDLAQTEVGVTLNRTGLLEYMLNGHEPTRRGNRSNRAAPHGAYRCRGNDRWCAIAVYTDKQWKAFCRIACIPSLTKDPKFATLLSRLENADELDKWVEKWTVNYPPEEVMSLLQSAGIPAGVVQTTADIIDNDPQIRERGFFVELDHPEIGKHRIPAPGYKLSETPATFQRAPCLGEHTEQICRDVLKMSDSEFMELLHAGVFE